MSQLATDPVFQSYIASVVVLSLNVLGLANATALTRGQASEVINPEDKRLNDKATVVYDEGNDKTQRYRRAHRNALENVPLFLITGLLLAMVGTSLTVAASIYAVFTVARILHSVCYVKGIQPFRTMFFVIAFLAQLTSLGFIVYAVWF
ncbi:MAPEG family protein [Nannocystaceae bacterium ST9]